MGKKGLGCHSPIHFKEYFVPKCYSRYKNVPVPDLQDLSYLYDWKEWLSPHIRDI